MQLDEAEKMGLPTLPITEVFRGEHDREMEKRMARLLSVLKENKDELFETAANVCYPHVYLIEPIKMMEQILEHHRLRVSLLKKLKDNPSKADYQVMKYNHADAIIKKGK